MPRLPRFTAKQIISILEKSGFTLARQSGSHKIYKKHNKRVTVPFHDNKILHPKVLKSILRDAEIGVGELEDLI